MNQHVIIFILFQTRASDDNKSLLGGLILKKSTGTAKQDKKDKKNCSVKMKCLMSASKHCWKNGST